LTTTGSPVSVCTVCGAEQLMVGGAMGRGVGAAGLPLHAAIITQVNATLTGKARPFRRRETATLASGLVSNSAVEAAKWVVPSA
jgi:hypothetical protein